MTNQDDNKAARDDLRAWAFNSDNLKPASKIVEHGGRKIEVRAPSDHVQSMAMSRAKFDAETKVMGDLSAMKTFLIIHCCFLPGTNTKVFELADEEAIKKAPVGGLFTKLWNALNKLTDEVDNEGKGEPPTQGGDSSDASPES